MFRKSDDQDGWKKQNKQQEANPLYKYVNLQKEGRLIDVYMEEGPEAVEALIRDELEPFLYNQGRGQLINKVNFIKWKNRVTAKLEVSISRFDLEFKCHLISYIA